MNLDSTLTTPDLGVDKEALVKSFVQHVQHTQGKHPSAATNLDHFVSLVRTARDRMYDKWTRTWKERAEKHPKQVYYLSLEFLVGRLLSDGLMALGIYDDCKKGLAEVGLELEEILEEENDAGLGNGGLGRLAACFIDSMATLGIPAIGYGLRYDYGIFRQDIVGGRQQEAPDMWLRYGNPWEIARPERSYGVNFGGRVIQYTGASGKIVHEWVDTESVLAVAHDIPVPGYKNDTVNTLRLWGARANKDFDISYFNAGDYARAVERKSHDENITRVLYPNDNHSLGKELRLKQEYFLVSATLQDCIFRHMSNSGDIRAFASAAAFQLNDTHPALAVAELMRILCDVHGLAWDEAWVITRESINYTNHTLLPEALEKWPVWLMERVLPRHLQIIYEINHRFLEGVERRFPGDHQRKSRMSIIEEGGERYVRMANLAVVGSSRVNGVSALHSQLLRENLFRDFDEYEPGKLLNQTNGVTPRRWMLKCNPGQTALLNRILGKGWEVDTDRLKKLEEVSSDAATINEWKAIKLQNKERLAEQLWKRAAIELDPSFMLDAQVKRIHEYKRQLLNLLHVVSLYQLYKADPSKAEAAVPRAFLFAGKAAPGYEKAKTIIWLINSVAGVINADPDIRQKLRVIFVPNYSVSWAELIIPATELSEQISTAGYEASGTGNMKFAMNGALTIGTMDGANVEMAENIGTENMFIFGLSAEEVAHTKMGYEPRSIYFSDRIVRGALDAISRGVFSPDDPGRFRGFVESLLAQDTFLVLEDFRSYVACHSVVEDAYRDQTSWTRKSILNVARMGFFSSDRTIQGYAREIWDVRGQVRGR
jgi:glycogen phosphorylase